MTIKEFLIQKGYKGPLKSEFRPDCVYYYRKIKEVNHQIQVYDYSIEKPPGNVHHGFEVEIAFECTNGVWAINKFYSLSENDIRTKLSEMEDKLYSTVEPMGGNKNTYEGGIE